MEKQLMPREDFRKIKAMNRQQMSDFFYSFSNNIANETIEENVVKIDLDVLKKEIGQIKGIGTTRLDEIMSVIGKHFETDEEKA